MIFARIWITLTLLLPIAGDALAQPLHGNLINEERCGGLRWASERAHPVRVYLDSSVDAWEGIIDAGLVWWGGGLFTRTSTRAEADVIIATEPTMWNRAVTLLRFDPQTCRINDALILFPLVPGSSAMHMVIHELGHALGLAHDDDPASIMFPTVHSPTLSNEDRDAILKLYKTRPFAIP